MTEVLLLIGATLGLCAASAVIPIINGELVLLGAVATMPEAIVPLVLVAAVGQMIGKCVMYGAGAGVVTLAEKKDEKKKKTLTRYIERYREKFESHPRSAAALVLVSSSVGLPPFYVISLLAGAFRFGFWRFAILGLIGRTARFAVIAAVPAAAHAIW